MNTTKPLTPLERLTKIYADCPTVWRGRPGDTPHRPGLTYAGRDLHALVGPLTLDEAVALAAAVPFTYGAFERDVLCYCLHAVAAAGATTFWLGREDSPVVYLAPLLPKPTLRRIFDTASEWRHDPNPQTGETMCRIWWD